MIRVVKHAALDSGRLKGLTLLLLLAIAICLASLVSGGSGISAKQAISALLGAGDEAARNVMMEVRLPRLLAAYGRVLRALREMGVDRVQLDEPAPLLLLGSIEDDLGRGGVERRQEHRR